MRAERRRLPWALLALVACKDAPAVAGPVRHFGALREIVHEGRTDAAVQLRDVVPGPHAYAVGALAGLRGEVTVVDDVVWTAIPDDAGAAAVRSGPAGDEAAALLVVARVPRWQSVVVEADIAADALDAAIERLAAQAGVDVAQPLAVRVAGTFSELAWHVVDGRKLAPGGSHAEHVRAGIREAATDVEAELVGFFSRAHAGVFTHHGERTHFHAVVGARTGHVDRAAIRRGARVFFPAP